MIYGPQRKIWDRPSITHYLLTGTAAIVITAGNGLSSLHLAAGGLQQSDSHQWCILDFSEGVPEGTRSGLRVPFYFSPLFLRLFELLSCIILKRVSFSDKNDHWWTLASTSKLIYYVRSNGCKWLFNCMNSRCNFFLQNSSIAFISWLKLHFYQYEKHT